MENSVKSGRQCFSLLLSLGSSATKENGLVAKHAKSNLMGTSR